MDRKNKSNINTLNYWDTRFGSGDWASKGGHSQTRYFAEDLLPYLDIATDYAGYICDFGCGAGDAFPIYHKAWPHSKLLGIDFSAAAIRLCKERYGHVAEFICGDNKAVPKVDIIICSNVLEHVDDDTIVVEQLLKQCKILYVIVPYKEHPLSAEHIRKYDEDSFSVFSVVRKSIIKLRGWTEFGPRSIAGIYMENILRYFRGEPARRRRLQIIFKLSSFPLRDF